VCVLLVLRRRRSSSTVIAKVRISKGESTHLATTPPHTPHAQADFRDKERRKRERE
jgi:hypothetical protein